MTTYLGVCGWPVAHSRSPQMHNAALAAVGLTDWRYLRLPLPPELFEEAVRALPAAGFRGVNVTIPHKHAALALADEMTVAAQAIGAANTLTFEDGRIHADNTDAPGLIAAIGEPVAGRSRAGARRGRRGACRGLGAAHGGGGRGGLEPHTRTGARAGRRARRAGGGALCRRADIVVNCTSVGLQSGEDPFKALPIEADELGAGSLVVDLVYRAGGTRFLEAARTRGARVIDGLEVLVAQGAASFERWTGMSAPREAMRAAATTIAIT